MLLWVTFAKYKTTFLFMKEVTLEDYVFCGPSMVFTNIHNPVCKYPQVGSDYYIKTLVKEGASIGANATIICGPYIGETLFNRSRHSCY